MRVLVVHPQEKIVQAIREQLGKWQVQTCANGLDGFIAAKDSEYDLILCSQNLSIITGIEMIRSIRNMSANVKTPVIFLAEDNDSEELIQLYERLRANVLMIDEVSSLKELDND